MTFWPFTVAASIVVTPVLCIVVDQAKSSISTDTQWALHSSENSQEKSEIERSLDLMLARLSGQLESDDAFLADEALDAIIDSFENGPDDIVSDREESKIESTTIGDKGGDGLLKDGDIDDDYAEERQADWVRKTAHRHLELEAMISKLATGRGNTENRFHDITAVSDTLIANITAVAPRDRTFVDISQVLSRLGSNTSTEERFLFGRNASRPQRHENDDDQFDAEIASDREAAKVMAQSLKQALGRPNLAASVLTDETLQIYNYFAEAKMEEDYVMPEAVLDRQFVWVIIREYVEGSNTLEYMLGSAGKTLRLLMRSMIRFGLSLPIAEMLQNELTATAARKYDAILSAAEEIMTRVNKAWEMAFYLIRTSNDLTRQVVQVYYIVFAILDSLELEREIGWGFAKLADIFTLLRYYGVISESMLGIRNRVLENQFAIGDPSD